MLYDDQTTYIGPYSLLCIYILIIEQLARKAALNKPSYLRLALVVIERIIICFRVLNNTEPSARPIFTPVPTFVEPPSIRSNETVHFLE